MWRCSDPDWYMCGVLYCVRSKKKKLRLFCQDELSLQTTSSVHMQATWEDSRPPAAQRFALEISIFVTREEAEAARWRTDARDDPSLNIYINKKNSLFILPLPQVNPSRIKSQSSNYAGVLSPPLNILRFASCSADLRNTFSTKGVIRFNCLSSSLLSPGLPLGGEYSCLDSNCSLSLLCLPPSPPPSYIHQRTHSPSQRCAFTGALPELQWLSLCGALDLLWQATHLDRTGTRFPPLIKNESGIFFTWMGQK